MTVNAPARWEDRSQKWSDDLAMAHRTTVPTQYGATVYRLVFTYRGVALQRDHLRQEIAHRTLGNPKAETDDGPHEDMLVCESRQGASGGEIHGGSDGAILE